MDWEMIGKLILAIIGLLTIATTIYYVVRISIKKKVNKKKVNIKTDQVINGNNNFQAGRDINVGRDINIEKE